jgi:hypothetical protein
MSSTATETEKQPKRPIVVAGAIVVVIAVFGAVYFVRQDRRPAEERIAAIPAAVKEAGTFRYTMSVSTVTEGNKTTATTNKPLTVGSPTKNSGSVDAKNERATTDLTLQNTKLQIVSDGKAAYVVVPEKLRDKTGGKEYARLKAGGLSPNLMAAAFSGAGSATNPMLSFADLRTPKAKIETIGHEKVRGTDTTHYRTTMDVTKTFSDVGTTSPAYLAELRKVPVDIWLDANDRPRRQVMTVKTSQVHVTTSSTTKTTVEAFDYGAKVSIPTPRPDQVFDGGADVLGALLGANQN